LELEEISVQKKTKFVYILHSFQNPEIRRSVLTLILDTDLHLRCNREKIKIHHACQDLKKK